MTYNIKNDAPNYQQHVGRQRKNTRALLRITEYSRMSRSIITDNIYHKYVLAGLLCIFMVIHPVPRAYSDIIFPGESYWDGNSTLEKAGDPFTMCRINAEAWCATKNEQFGWICDLAAPIEVFANSTQAVCHVKVLKPINCCYQYYAAGGLNGYFVAESGCGNGEMTQLGCSGSGRGSGSPNCPAGNPIDLSSANKFQQEYDYAGNGGFPLQVVRSFNSKRGAWRFLPEIGALGQLNQSFSEGAAVLTRRPDGKYYVFVRGVSNTWSTSADVSDSLLAIEDAQGIVVGWLYITLDQVTEEYDPQGKLLSVTDRTGIRHTYSYNANDITVNHSNGNFLVYQIDSANDRISGFTTHDNKAYTYNYDTSGNLIGITYPDNGGTRTYHYEDPNFPNALTGITDANGDRFATWAYNSEGRAISSEHSGSAEKVTIDYTDIDDPTDPRAVATNALGKQTTYHFADIFGARKIVQVEGHQSTNCAAANKNYTYDVNGFMASKTDWKGNTTTYVRNTKGQELSRTEAFGTPDARTITTEWHPTFNLRTKVTEPDRETTYTYDANSNLLSQQTTDLLIP